MAKKTKSRRRKKKKHSLTPKRPLTAYFMFASDVRQEVRAAHPDKRVTEITKVIAKKWHALTETKKTEYKNKYVAAKKVYDGVYAEFVAEHPSALEMGFLTQSSDTDSSSGSDDGKKKKKQKKKKKKKKDPNAPRRPLTGYFRFMSEQRPIFKSKPKNKDKNGTQIRDAITSKWKTMSAEQKEPYTKAYKKEKKTFDVTWKKYQAEKKKRDEAEAKLNKKKNKHKHKKHKRVSSGSESVSSGSESSRSGSSSSGSDSGSGSGSGSGSSGGSYSSSEESVSD